MRKTMKATGLVVLVLLMLFSAIACKGNKGSAPQSGSVSDKVFPGGWKPTTSYDEKLHFTSANVQTIEGYDYTAGDAYCKWLSDTWNYTIEVTSLTFDNWSERLRIWVNSGDMPDVTVFDYNHADMATWVDQGLVKRFPDNWKQRWPNLAKVFERTSLGPQMEIQFKGTYFFPRSRFNENVPHLPLPNHASFYFRKDWAQAVGFPVKTAYTTSEIIEYGRLIKEKDPGKLGAKLLPLSNNPNWANRLFVGGNYAHFQTFYQDTDGKYKWGPASEKTLLGLKLWYRAWAAGILNPEFYAVQDLEDYGQFRVSGVSGGYFGEATVNHMNTTHTLFAQNNLGPDPYECIGVATALGEDGYYHLEDLINYWGVVIFNPEISNEKFERWMDLMDYCATKDGYFFRQLGFEGIDWKQEDNGELVSLLEPGQSLQGATGKYPSLYSVIPMAQQGDDLSFMNPSTPKRLRDYSRALYEERSRLSTPETLTPTNWAIFSYDSPSMRKTTLDFKTEYANLVASAKSEADLENLWRRWIEIQKPLIQPVLDELNNLK